MTNEIPDLKDNRYKVFVEWSKRDRAFVGRCPALMIGGTHGDDEVETYKKVFDMLISEINEGCTTWTKHERYIHHQPTKWVDWDKDGKTYIGKCFHEGKVEELCSGDNRVDVYKKLCKKFDEKYSKQVVTNKCFEFPSLNFKWLKKRGDTSATPLQLTV